eukprot:403339880
MILVGYYSNKSDILSECYDYYPPLTKAMLIYAFFGILCAFRFVLMIYFFVWAIRNAQQQEQQQQQLQNISQSNQSSDQQQDIKTVKFEMIYYSEYLMKVLDSNLQKNQHSNNLNTPMCLNNYHNNQFYSSCEIQSDNNESQKNQVLTNPYLYSQSINQQNLQNIQQNYQQSETCPICCDNFKALDLVTYLDCNIKHVYHSACIQMWLGKNDTCPLCKQNVLSLNDQIMNEQQIKASLIDKQLDKSPNAKPSLLGDQKSNIKPRPKTFLTLTRNKTILQEIKNQRVSSTSVDESELQSPTSVEQTNQNNQELQQDQLSQQLIQSQASNPLSRQFTPENTIYFNIMITLQFCYVFPYFLLTVLSFTFLYCYQSELSKLWDSKQKCDKEFISWFVCIVLYCPIAAILSIVFSKQIYNNMNQKVYLLHRFNKRVKHYSIQKLRYLVVYLVIDLYHIVWSISGMIIDKKYYNRSQCSTEVSQVAYTGGFITGMGFVFILRFLYLILIYVIGRNILGWMHENQAHYNRVDIKFESEEWDRNIQEKLVEEYYLSKLNSTTLTNLSDSSTIRSVRKSSCESTDSNASSVRQENISIMDESITNIMLEDTSALECSKNEALLGKSLDQDSDLNKLDELNNVFLINRSESTLQSHADSSRSASIVSEQIDMDCSICFCNFESQEIVVRLPCDKIRHIYHEKCIKEWLTNHDLCPLCKKNIIHMNLQQQILKNKSK